MKYIKPKKLKVLMILFFGTGIMGIVIGLSIPSQTSFSITSLAVINLCLGGLVGWIFLTQKPRLKDKRKK
jgi:hypothetical protein